MIVINKCIFPALLFAFLSCSVQEPSKIDSHSSEVVKVFFDKLQGGNHDVALQELLTQNEKINLTDSSTINLINQFKYINEVSGKYIGADLLKKRIVLNDLCFYTYLVKYEHKFYRFFFQFYNNGINTKIYRFKFDDTLDLEVEESLKLYTE